MNWHSASTKLSVNGEARRHGTINTCKALPSRSHGNAPVAPAPACQNRAFLESNTDSLSTMDVEHINAIGNTLADLTKRTVDLRGYL
ncbi:MAG TPA: hypothetical protein VIO33_01515 [Burkholderiaceae bacterium]